MRTCPACKAEYSAGEETCPKDGSVLVDAMVMSDTMRSTGTDALGSYAVSPTLSSPQVRSSGPGGPGGLRDSAVRGQDSLVGVTLNERYEITRKLGEGGMGAVYEARHKLIGKRVAIKVLLDKYAQKADVVARLQQEARLASSIGHEHIVDITDFGETFDGRTFVVMEFLDGESLAQLLAREGPLQPTRTFAIGRQIASALGAAHGKGIVHRDVKPENVFITRRAEKDFVKVVDFGISKAMRPAEDAGGGSNSPRLTQTGMVLGTPLYMSPEQARGEDDLDHRIDVYALGVILYEMLTGEVPYRGTNYLSIISQVLSTDPKRPSEVRPDLAISAAVEAVVMKAMARDRAERYPSMIALDGDLAQLESGGEVVMSSTGAHRSARVRTLETPRPRRRAAMWVGGVAVVVVATAFAVKPLVAPKQTAAAATTPPVPAPVQPPAPVPAQPAPEVPVITAHVTSEPLGAEVFHGGRSYGATPVDIPVPKGKDEYSLTLKLDGYEDTSAAFFPTGDQEVTVKLSKKKPEPKGGMGKPGGAGKPGGGTAVKPGGTTAPDARPAGEEIRLPSGGEEIQDSPYHKKP